jgi:hypothetical protein
MLARTFALTGLVGMLGCNSAPFTPSTPPDCSRIECTCEQDPSQPTCTGVPTPDGGLRPGEGGLVDLDAGDAEADASGDGSAPGDAGDAGDGG